MTQKVKIDVQKSIEYFFKLPDWKMRAAVIGGVPMLWMVAYLMVWVLFMIPFIGWILAIILIIVSIVLAVGFTFYLFGYKYDLMKSIVKQEKAPKLEFKDFNQDIMPRVKHGFTLWVSQVAYYLPVIFLYVVGYVAMFIPIFLARPTVHVYYDPSSTGAPAASLVGMLIFFVFFGVAALAQLFVQFCLEPYIYFQYYQEQSFSSVFNFKGIWPFVKQNVEPLIIYVALTFGFAFVFSMAAMLTSLTIFLCIGVILLPIVYAVGIAYFIHMQANILGQMIRNGGTGKKQIGERK